jgi:hypothetical protein
MSDGPSEQVVDQGFGLMPQEDNQQDASDVTQQQEQIPEVKGNPAWDELLSQVPAGLHGVLTPHLQKWDTNYQQGLQKVHSQYEPYKPFIDEGIDPTSLNNALLVMQNLEADPEKFARALVEHYGLNLAEQGQEEAEQEQSEELPYDISMHPEFQKVQQMTELLAQQTLTQHEAAQEAQAEAELDQSVAAAKEQYGEFDEEYVYQKMYSTGCDLETAVQAFMDMRNQWVQNYQPPGANAPRLMGSGGGLPSQATPARNLTGAQRRALMVQTLQNLKASGG